jgi:hypothetical protein
MPVGTEFNAAASQTTAVYYVDIIIWLMKQCLFYATESKLRQGPYRGGFRLTILMALTLQGSENLLLQNIPSDSSNKINKAAEYTAYFKGGAKIVIGKVNLYTSPFPSDTVKREGDII